MQKKCKKMQNLLHMSKKSSTFVADLGIVPVLTIKTNRVMRKKVVCRFMIGGKILRLVERTETGGRWSDYVIMDGRKRAEHGRVFNTYETAWDTFESNCKLYFNYVMEGGVL